MAAEMQELFAERRKEREARAQDTVDRVEAKLRDLQRPLAHSDSGASVLTILLRAADLYRRQIRRGLDGDPRAAGEARLTLRQMIPDRIKLLAEKDGSLWAEYNLQPRILLKGAGACGRGDRI